ncbi:MULTISPECIES: SRPBCC family protein [Stenotrophomonas]|uniref:SRPBCC domain-containing protein n=1 Tax=Stenotrophomonas lactitubi TaxID=2045214 RepID=A0AAW4GFS3_9GAMM|nr:MULTISPECIES: SRPBCC domain-containing protein [Stenotrophomonas]MBM9913313.1 SRPBCC domain-containing protein [Stenotrophomonas lactitubi]MBM9923199.1 SRPBCC domain-containing protein [Stenotrophomonas lactitubi]MBM9939090.1 SRPBCC domain-containing protein [Stenotrophomonas lactitubi]
MVDIAHRVGINAASAQVYQALASPEGIAAWWAEDTTGDRHPGGTVTARFTAKGQEIGAMQMKLLQLQPNELVLWEFIDGPPEWIGTTARFALHQDGDYCIVLFTHEGWKERVEFMHHCSTKWAIFLMSLKSLLETGRGQPSPHDIKIDNWN